MAIELKSVHEQDEALICMLRSVNELYEEHQRGAKSMRKGFLNMAKARQSMGRGALSALDCREEMNAQLSICHIGGNEVSLDDVSASRLFSKDRATGSTRSQNVLRRRAVGEEEDESSEVTEVKEKDPMFMFGGLAPPALRRSKEDFTVALDHYIAAANLIHRISTLQKSLGSTLGDGTTAEPVLLPPVEPNVAS